ncbi:hypothetical protein [Mycobacterium sp. E740]|uniref:hypothetical protein n=1 Tax=Mycobacterium sp. E740 TaxID=1834149 RepID=UPI000801EB6B|nr:hypothetical protein [Mycobacterium sp. E740]OBI80075.1 hypothetical protein A5663_18195 [Mycobacterium sp. E740]
MAGWLRSRAARRLLWAALVMCLVLGVAVALIAGTESQDGNAGTLGDDQATSQVVTAARQVVAAAHLQQPAGGYAFMSCDSEDGPPYQVVMYMSFVVPQHQPAQYLDTVTAALVADGWSKGAAQAEHFGVKLTKPGLTAVLNRAPRQPRSATLRLYGECRVGGDHGDDNPVWTEVAF